MFSTGYLAISITVGAVVGVCGTVCTQLFMNKKNKGKANEDAEIAA
jgi:hypothetical protein